MPRPPSPRGPLPAAFAAGTLMGVAVAMASLAGGGGTVRSATLPELALPETGPAMASVAAPGAALARPPFSPGRRPPAKPLAGPIAEPAPSELRLTGIIAGAAGGVAMAIDLRTQQPVTLRAGSPFQDWTVEKVDRNSVLLRRGNETRLLTLPLPKPASTGPVP